MGINEEPLLHGHQNIKGADLSGQRYWNQGSPFLQRKQEQKLQEEQECVKQLQERLERIGKEIQRLKYEAEKQRKKINEEKQRKKRDEEKQRKRDEENQRKRDEENQRKRDEENQRKRDEEKRQQEKIEEEELRKKREEENQRRKEEEVKAKEAREREERNERIRRRAEQMRQMREQQAEKEREEWDNVWLRYVLQWEKIKINGIRGTSERLRETIPWPVKSSNYKDVSEAAIQEFFQKSLPQDADPVKILAYMKAECLKWHTDRIPRMFGKIEDETLTSLFKTVAQVVVRLRVEKARK